jgi:Caspase domain
MAKKALVVGINDYTNWNNGVTIGNLSLSAPSLQWCVDDSNAFADLLKSGFSFDEVTTLQDAQATSQAILDGITGLLNSSAAGDTVCFYFSGHGGRMPETPGSASTRYYETIIPYDAAMISSMQVATIAQNLPPSQINFTLVLDSCHSGGMFLSPESRGFTWSKDAALTFQAACEAIVPWICVVDPSACDGNVSGLKVQDSGLCTMAVDSAKDSPEEAKATLLSACDYGELSSESSTVKHGYFTQAILDIVNACNFQISHPDLLSQLLQKVNSYAGGSQTPQLRGRPVRLQEDFLAGWNYSV